MASRSIASLRLAARLFHGRSFLWMQPPIRRHNPLFSIIRSAANDSVIHHPQFSLSYLSFSTLRRSQPPRSAKKLDIGAKARQLQRRRLWTYALVFSGLAIFMVIVLNNFQDALVFYVTPTEAFEKLREDPSKSRFRLGGLVLEGSVLQPLTSSEMEFVVTDLVSDILVRYKGSLPDLFREGHSVVVEGLIKPVTDEIREQWKSHYPDETDGESLGSGGSKSQVTAKARSGGYYFSAAEVLAKHDEKYMPAEVAQAIEKNRQMIKAQAEEAAEEKRKQEEASIAPPASS